MVIKAVSNVSEDDAALRDKFCDELHTAVVDIARAYNSPRRDALFLKRAGIKMNRALFPLLAITGSEKPMGVVEKAEIVGRNYTTVSRQLRKLEELGYIRSHKSEEDDRSMVSVPAPKGRLLIEKMQQTRHEYIEEILRDWNDEDRNALLKMLQRFADDFKKTDP
jgi:DNA-binding MarR family transcriptional regulator